MNDEAWLSELFEQDYALLYRVGRVFLGRDTQREDLIEDQIQEAFVRAWQKRSALRKHPNPDGWMVECFRRCLMNACRKQAHEYIRRSFTPDAEETQPIAEPSCLSPEDYVRTNEQLSLLRKLLGNRDADIFLRYCVHGETAAAIAPALGITEQALRMRVSRIKKKVLANRDLFACLVVLCLLSLG